MALIFDQEIFDTRTNSIMDAFLRENLHVVLEFLNQIISQPLQVPAQTYLEAFSAANSWCVFSTRTFIPHEGFITNIFALLNGNQAIHGIDMSKKVIKIIKKLLCVSKHAHSIQNGSLEVAAKSIPMRDMRFLELVVQYLNNNR